MKKETLTFMVTKYTHNYGRDDANGDGDDDHDHGDDGYGDCDDDIDDNLAWRVSLEGDAQAGLS